MGAVGSSLSLGETYSSTQASSTDQVDPMVSPEDVELKQKWDTLQLTPPGSVGIEDIRFMMTSKLAFSIALFKNSTKQGQERHALRYISDAVCMKKEGAWVPLAEVRASLEYDPRQDKLVSKANADEVWSYLSPHGLVKFDRYKYEALPVVEQLSQEEQAAILAQAQTFWDGEQPEVDVGQKKECVLQIVTTNRVHSEAWATENLMRGYPEHATFRVIAPNGNVYSFGFQMEKEEENSIFKDKDFSYPLTFLKATETRITAPDYEEARPYRLKRGTSIPMTEARMNNILAFVAEQSNKGITFNFIRQNCATLARELLNKAGVASKPERWTLGRGLASLLPEWNKVPYIGRPLAFVMGAINFISKKIFDTFTKYVPEPIRAVVTFIPRKISALLANIFLVAIGARLASQKHQEKMALGVDADDLDNRNSFTCFNRLVRKFGDMFREDLSDVDAHSCLINWQTKQSSTQVHRSDNIVKLVF